MSREMEAEDYLKLPYTKQVEPRVDSDGTSYYVAWIEEIPSVRIDGDTREEALGKLVDCLEDFVAMMLAAGDEVPAPKRWPHSIGVSLEHRSRNVTPPLRAANGSIEETPPTAESGTFDEEPEGAQPAMSGS